MRIRVPTAALLACMLFGGQATAAEARGATYRLDIPAQNLSDALQALAIASQNKLLYSSELVDGKSAPAIKGIYTTEQAVQQLLNGTNLTYEISDGLVLIRAKDSKQAAPIVGASSAEQRTSDPVRLAQNDQSVPSPESAKAGPTPPKVVELAEIIVVTGSRIDQGELRSPTPVMSLDSSEIEAAAQANIADLVNRLPSARPSFTPSSTTNLPAAMGNFLDLRGLGAQRTLVLLDGQRIVPALLTGAVDVGQIPQALINGIDVVTGGASAAWGSDAVAGVVNFRTDNRLEGVKAVVQGGATSHEDNENYLASLAYGAKFADGRGHSLFAGEYFHNEGSQGEFVDRDWTRASWVRFLNPNYTPSNSEPLYLFLPNVNFLTSSSGGLITNTALRGIDFVGSGATPTMIAPGTYRTTTSQVGGGGTPALTFRVPVADRRSAYSSFEYEFGPALTVRASASWAQSKNVQHTNGTSTVRITRDNPFLPASVAAQMDTLGVTNFNMGRRYDEIGTPIVVDSDQQRYALSAFGDLGGSWRWDSYYTYGVTERRLTVDNLTLSANVINAVDAILDPVTGQPVCRSVAARAAGCQPANMFGTGNISAAAIDYMLDTAEHRVTVRQQAAAVTLRGEPVELWAGPLAIAVGGEYRLDSGKLAPNALTGASLFSSYNYVGYSAHGDVIEGFGEIAFPLLKELPAAERVDVDLAARYTDYSVSGAATTWKGGLTWDVIRGVRLRASQSRDIRAPSLQELFASGATTFLNVLDPLTGGIYGVSLATVGNPGLTEETADTLTAGIVLEPSFARGLRLSADYFDIRMDDAIISLTPQTVVNRCYGDAPQACSLIVRDPTTNLITFVNNAPINLQRVMTNGVDIDLSYTHSLGAGVLSLRGLATFVNEVELNDGLTRVEYAGTVAQPSIESVGGVPHRRFMGTARYEIGRFNFGAGFQYMGGGKVDPIANSPKISNVLSTKSQTMVDLDVSYDLLGDDRCELFGIVNNLLDADPPITGVASATTRGLYEELGRSFTVGIRLKL